MLTLDRIIGVPVPLNLTPTSAYRPRSLDDRRRLRLNRTLQVDVNHRDQDQAYQLFHMNIIILLLHSGLYSGTAPLVRDSLNKHRE
jgi:hypothetical protein